ncbi:MAG: hypothetical protein WC584_01490 [Candidatus Pacearchaeota archaeon]
MPAQDITRIKEKIISFLRIRGPSLPIHIAKEIQMTMLFSSAFLSELISEKKVKLSHMRVGSSPLYLLQGQENRLENYSNFLNSKEKEAFALLKEKKFLIDKKQEPAIRVALRSIRDFAIPFKHQDEIYWRYFTIPEGEIKIEKEIPTPPVEKKQEQLIEPKIIETSKLVSNQEELNIFDKKLEIEKKKKIKVKKLQKPKKDDKFFDKVKEYLQKENIEILSVEGVNKSELILRIKEDNEERILFALNKKKIKEIDIIKAFRKIPPGAKYSILCLGEPLKKLNELLESAKTLSEIKKIE